MIGIEQLSTNNKYSQREALSWIVQEIERHNLSYQVVGGLAAIAHGASRPLHDIDLYVPFDDPNWPNFLASVQSYVTWGPKAVIEEGAWDLLYVKISYHDQKIEIGDSNRVRIRDSATGKWIEQVIQFDSSDSKTVLGCEIDVMPVDQLISYKRLLGRAVDEQDIEDLTRNGHDQLPERSG